MQISHILAIFIVIKGVVSIKLFVQTKNFACILDYLNERIDQPASRACVTIVSKYAKEEKLEYNYKMTVDYYADLHNPYSNVILQGSPFNGSAELLSKCKSDFYLYPFNGFTVDWIHNRVYIIMRHVVSVPIKYAPNLELAYLSNLSPYPRMVIAQKSIYDSIKSIKVDPYRGYLFTFYEGDNTTNETYVNLIRSNLRGLNLTLIMKKPLVKSLSTFSLDINDMRLFVAIKDVLYIYDYEGLLLREVLLPYSVTDFVVFENNVYLTTPQVSRTIKVSLNQTNNPLAIGVAYQHDLGRAIKIGIADARASRQKMNGKYLCDRTDCPERCEVDSSGDNCVCFHNRAKTMDGVMCYNCGQSKLTSMVQQPTIVNGRTSYAGDFPWHAALYNITTEELICGGTLISSLVVLTAAHCVTTPCAACTPQTVDPEGLRVAFGKTIRSWNITEQYETRRGITRILIKDTFLGVSTRYANDLALLFLDSKVSVNSHVMPACLDYNLNQLPYQESLTGYVCGFGITKECVTSCANFSDTLIYTTGTIVSTDECLVALNMRDQSVYHSLTWDKFCIGNGTVSVVQKGDSGGGYTLSFRGLHYLTGVVSVKIMRQKKTQLKYSFGGFTNVSAHMDWIKQNIVSDS